MLDGSKNQVSIAMKSRNIETTTFLNFILNLFSTSPPYLPIPYRTRYALSSSLNSYKSSCMCRIDVS
jgi:hypothetical protein